MGHSVCGVINDYCFRDSDADVRAEEKFVMKNFWLNFCSRKHYYQKNQTENCNAVSRYGKTGKVRPHGFTLAEVLITLGIIGVIAAMTIPILLQNMTNKKFSALMREDYAILAQLMLEVNDAGALTSMTVENDMDEMRKAFDTYFLPYIKTVSVCYDEPGCWADEKISSPNGNTLKWIDAGKIGGKVICFTLVNGSFVCMDDYPDYELQSMFGINDTSERELVLFVDINGKYKPNVLGKDVFIFVIDNNGSLIPAGNSKTKSEQEDDCSKTGTGAFCAAYLKSVNWDFNRLKF